LSYKLGVMSYELVCEHGCALALAGAPHPHPRPNS
jgi:hypothetical protein